MFGSGDLAAFDFAGKQLWSRNLCKEFGKFSINFLYSSSPLLYQNRLYLQVLQRDPPVYSYATDEKPRRESLVLCLEPSTGTNIWLHIRKTDALAESQESYATPVASEMQEILVAGGGYLTAHSPATGEELWRVAGLNNPAKADSSRLVASPVSAQGLIFVCQPKRGSFLAIRDGSRGDVAANQPAWSSNEFTSDCPTPLVYQSKLFVLDGDKQLLTCLGPKSGKTIWQQNLGVHEIFRASPTGADGKIYCLSHSATAVVLNARDGKILSNIRMEEEPAHSTIVAAGGHLFLRTAENIYCIGKK
jgi:outer membrane protein assembly factor BamB